MSASTVLRFSSACGKLDAHSVAIQNHVFTAQYKDMYPLENYWKWPFIVDLPTQNCDFPYIVMLNYQRVTYCDLVKVRCKTICMSSAAKSAKPCSFLEHFLSLRQSHVAAFMANLDYLNWLPCKTYHIRQVFAKGNSPELNHRNLNTYSIYMGLLSSRCFP